MAYSHTHNTNTSYRKSFAIGIILNIIFIVIEIFYGLIANSSALLADAGHNVSDVLGLAFAWLASWLATLKPKGNYTFGLRKTTILVSILNSLLLFSAVILIGADAIKKFQNPEPIGSIEIIIVASAGVIINSITALFFIKGQKHDLNIRGAFLHMAADAGVSLGVVISGILILVTGKLRIDPIMSFLIIFVILWSTWQLFSESLKLALDAVPKNININKVRIFLESQEGIESIHDLHIWAISTTKTALTVHLIMPKGSSDQFLTNLQKQLKEKFNIEHTTFQIENNLINKNFDPNC